MEPYYDADGVTLYHGDARDVLRELAAGSVDAIVTDPPFKLSQEYASGVGADNLAAVASLSRVSSEMFRAAVPGALAAIFYDSRILPYAIDEMRRSGWEYLRNLTLYRRWGTASKMLGWMSTSDFVLIYAKPGQKFRFYSTTTRHDVYIRAAPESADWGHPAQKPLDCVQHIVENLTPPGGVVLDPYVGSGATLEAAVRSGRRAIGIEMQERYCETAVARLAQMTLDLEVVA